MTDVPAAMRESLLPQKTPVRPIAGPYKDQVQYCIRCGCTLMDNRNTQIVGCGIEGHWPEGIVIEMGNGKSVGDDPDAVDCSLMPTGPW